MWNSSFHLNRYRLAWLPVFLCLAVFLALSGIKVDVPVESPYLLFVLNFIFTTMVSVFVAGVMGTSFLRDGTPGTLFLGVGMMVFGLGGLMSVLATILHFGEANTRITIYNSCIWLSSLCHLAGAAVQVRWANRLKARWAWLAMVYTAALTVIAFITVTAMRSMAPTFFVTGHGGTPIRQFVLMSAVAMFLLAAFIIRSAGSPRNSQFSHFYSLGLLLLAIGLFGVLLHTVSGDLSSWASRITQYVGGIYFTMAAAAFARKQRDTAAFNLAPPKNWQRVAANVGIAAAIVFSSAIIRLTFLQTLGLSVPYVTFFPAVMLAAVYGGLWAGLTATVLSTVVAAYFWIHPTLQLIVSDPADVIGVVIFFVNGIMISFISWMMQRAQKRAAAAEHEARLALEREHTAQALREKDQLLRTLIDSSPDPIFLKDHEGRLLVANEATLAVLGKTAADVLGKTYHEVHANHDDALQIRDNDMAVLYSNTVLVAEETVTTPSGPRTFLSTKAPYHDASGRAVGVVGVAQDISQKKRVEREILEYQERLRQMASEISCVEEQERRRIATVLHDEIGQVLILIKLKLDSLKSAEPDTGRKEEIREIGELLKQTIGFTRSLTNELIPPLLYEVGLQAAIESLCDDYANRYGLRVTCQNKGQRLPFDSQQVILFKAVRELLVNIVKHAQARNVTVTIDSADDFIGIRVEDDGIGVETAKQESPAGKNGGFGLFNLRERILYSGGSFSVHSRPDQGTRVSLRLPRTVHGPANRLPATDGV